MVMMVIPLTPHGDALYTPPQTPLTFLASDGNFWILSCKCIYTLYTYTITSHLTHTRSLKDHEQITTDCYTSGSNSSYHPSIDSKMSPYPIYHPFTPLEPVSSIHHPFHLTL